MTKVMVFGAFDPLHRGHRDFFKQAKKLGDHLIVVVARDESIKRIKNHESRIKENQRLSEIEKIKEVDQAILGDLERYGKVIEDHDPDIIALGYDQKVPEGLKNTLKKYKIITLKPFKSEIYKSSKIIKQ